MDKHTTESAQVTPQEAAGHARHYLSHVTDGWDGYSLDDASDYTAWRMIDFLTGAMTYESDVRPLCDEWCEPPAVTPPE